MALTVKEIIDSALRKLLVVSSGNEGTPSQLDDGLEALQVMMRSWSEDVLTQPSPVRRTVTLTTGQREYTYGTGGDFNFTRPVQILSATLRDTSGTDRPLPKRGIYDLNNVVLKTTETWPSFFYYQPSYPLGQVIFDQEPDQAFQVIFDVIEPFDEITGLSQTPSLPPAFERALIYNLAIELAEEYGIDPPQAVVAKAVASHKKLRKNERYTPKMSANVHQRRGRYNINTGD